jgi:exopolyphosphatase/guanosine-5'-triphosphate,3'-diphosphate pyrophosphatase
MRFAVIDLGTNSVRFDVYQILRGQQVQRLHREKVMVRLGQGVFLDGKLDRNAAHRTYLAFLRFKRTAAGLHVQRFVAFGTSALRETQDSRKFTKFIFEKTGIEIRIITGLEEAHLIGRGILYNERLPKGRFAIVDVGGGSTEILICQGKRILFAESFPLGTARLQQIFLKRSPPKPDNLKQLRAYIRSAIVERLREAEIQKVPVILGASGTVRAVSNLVRKRGMGREINTQFLKALNEQMVSMSTTQLLGIPGMESDRVDMILAGSLLLEEVSHALKCRSIRPTLFSLRDGILAEQLQVFAQHQPSHLALHIEDLISRAKVFGQVEATVRRNIAMAERLFEGTKKLHKLKSEWRVYLIAATILRKTGEAISPANHNEHSAYIVRNAQLPSMEKWETEFIALLCLHYDNKKIDLGQSPAMPGSRRVAFMKILSLLRLVDAFDSDPRTRAEIVGIRSTSKAVRLHYTVKPNTDFELIRLERKKPLFEKMFRKELIGVRI